MERECPTETNGDRAGSRHGDFERSREGKLVSSERRRHTITEVRRRLGPRGYRDVERVVCSTNEEERNVINHVRCPMSHGCFKRCVHWPGNVYTLGLNVLIGGCWNVTGTSTTSGSTISGSGRTCKSGENNIAGDAFQAAARIAACVVRHNTRITFGRTGF